MASGASTRDNLAAPSAALIAGYYGIYVTGGAAGVTNDGTVAAVFDAIRLAGDGSVANYGTIIATNSTGVLISGAGTIINGSAADTTAAIYAAVGVYIHAGMGTVVNYGTITASFASGVYVYGGAVTNGSTLDTAALISASNIGIQRVFNMPSRRPIATSRHRVSGGYFAGVDLENNGTVTNGWSLGTAALIASGDFGIYMYGGMAAVVNYATVATTGTLAIAGISLANGGSVNAGTIGGYGHERGHDFWRCRRRRSARGRARRGVRRRRQRRRHRRQHAGARKQRRRYAATSAPALSASTAPWSMPGRAGRSPTASQARLRSHSTVPGWRAASAPAWTPVPASISNTPADRIR